MAFFICNIVACIFTYTGKILSDLYVSIVEGFNFVISNLNFSVNTDSRSNPL